MWEGEDEDRDRSLRVAMERTRIEYRDIQERGDSMDAQEKQERKSELEARRVKLDEQLLYTGQNSAVPDWVSTY